MRKLVNIIRRFKNDERGAGLVEYALIIVTIAIVVFGVISALGNQLSTTFTNIKNKLAPTG